MNTDKFKNAIEAIADDRIKTVTVTQGFGSDGPFIQPDYYVHVVLQNDEKLELSVYHYHSEPKYYIPLRTRDDPEADLITKLSDAISTVKIHYK